jgi:RNA polymerase sigma factor (sigma-70 family)
MTTDCELLRRYAEGRDEAAFAEIVRRHTDFVYSVALRVTMNGALAQDATQAVFAKLAQQAAALCHYGTLVGWLHTTARHCAINLVRGEERRRAREQEAVTMQDHATTPEVNWTNIAPLLDEAVGTLHEPDRHAVLLRFFKGWNHQQVGEALGLSEDAAQKRVERALEKLRAHFARRGVRATSALLAAAIGENSVQAAPAGLAEGATQASLAGAGVVTESIFLKILLMSTKNKTLLAAALILMVTVPLLILWQSSNQRAGATQASPVKSVPMMASSANTIVASPAVAAAPIAPPAPNPVASQPLPNSSPDTIADPQADLKTAIPDIVRLLRSGHQVAFLQTYFPPGTIDPQYIERLQKYQQQVQAIFAQHPEALSAQVDQQVQQQGVEYAAEYYEAIEDQTPAFNDTGDEATYNRPTNGTMVFVKIDGKWYIKSGSWGPRPPSL